jgi:hypothetical protein
MLRILAATLLAVLLRPLPVGAEVDVTLRGSPESMVRQHRVAVEAEYTFVATLEEMEALAEEGRLVSVPGGPDYEVMDWVFPYALPEVRTFVERFASQYRQACGERLVVTSLTRPASEQPPNSHQLSVHPAGMAVDLRISQSQPCRQFLEDSLLGMEERGLLDITRERAPPHYHIAIFPEPYGAFAAARIAEEERAAAATAGRPRVDAAGETRARGRRGPAVLLLMVLLIGAAAGWAIWSMRRRVRRPPPPAA